MIDDAMRIDYKNKSEKPGVDSGSGIVDLGSKDSVNDLCKILGSE